MTVRTTRATIPFLRPFKLRDLDDIQPAGDYVDRGPIEAGIPTRRNTSAHFCICHTSRPQNRTEVLSVSPAELDAVLESDRIVRA